MAKILKGNTALVLRKNEAGDIECRMDGDVEYEDGFTTTKSHVIDLSESQKQTIRNFVTNVAIPQFKEKEGGMS